MVTIRREEAESSLHKGGERTVPGQGHYCGTGRRAPSSRPLWETGRHPRGHGGSSTKGQVPKNREAASSPGREGRAFQHIPGYLTTLTPA